MQNNHNGSEFKNIVDTWEENEKRRAASNTPEDDAPKNDLEQLIKQEASEYDNENKENRVLAGDRATVNDNSVNETSGT